MRKIEFKSFENEENIEKINDVTNQINGFIKKIENSAFKDDYEILYANITNVLKYWSGNTFLGDKKSTKAKRIYQNFFESLLKLIFCIKDSCLFLEEFKDYIDGALYQGTLYRYLGYSSEEYHFLKNKEQYVEPIFDSIFVSWSKESKNCYIESKLSGPITYLECETGEDLFGIDLSFFGVSRGEESEVVFPTIKEKITAIKYI